MTLASVETLNQKTETFGEGNHMRAVEKNANLLVVWGWWKNYQCVVLENIGGHFQDPVLNQPGFLNKLVFIIYPPVNEQSALLFTFGTVESMIAFNR